jgi:hypothetical protein
MPGKDGKAYTAPVKTDKPNPGMNAWKPDGYAWRQVQKTIKTLAKPLGGLSPIQLANLQKQVQDLIEAAEALQNEITEQSTLTTYKEMSV